MSKRKHKQFGKRSLTLENLETRELMAADVGVYFDNAGLHVVESAEAPGGDNAIQITQAGTNLVQVTGLAAQDQGRTLVNGHISQIFPAPAGLFINLGGGSDTVVVGGTSPVHFTTININVAAPGASANDNDEVFLSNVNTTGSVDIATGVGNDFVDVENSTIGNYTALNHLVIATGADADTVRVNGTVVIGYLDVYTYTSQSETAPDFVSMQQTAATDNMQIITAAGNDTVKLTNVGVGKRLDIITGAGKDTLTANSLQVIDSFFADLGAGDDTASFQNLQAHSASLNGGAGYDTLTHTNDGPIGSLSLTNWEVINGRRLIRF